MATDNTTWAMPTLMAQPMESSVTTVKHVSIHNIFVSVIILNLIPGAVSNTGYGFDPHGTGQTLIYGRNMTMRDCWVPIFNPGV
jgi:hypothetical protein